MRPLWKGAISFGLVNIPVRLYTATEKKDLKFRYLHAECGTPVEYQKRCPTCNREISQDEIVYGYEYERGRFVTLKEEDFDSIPVETTRAISIVDFVNLEEIDPIYFNKTYFLEPSEGGGKPYALLRRAMESTNRIAIAKVVIRSKESLAAIRVYQGKGLIMETMFWPDEVRSINALSGVDQEPKLHENEIKMAVDLIGNLADKFEPEKYTNEYRQALLEMIENKIQGEQVTVAPTPEVGKVVDLMEALRASIKMTEEAKRKTAGADN